MTYADLKAIIAKKNLAWQYDEDADKISVWALDGIARYGCELWKIGKEAGGINVTQNAADLAEFNANYKSVSNYAIGHRSYAFATGDFDFAGDGVLASVPKGTLANIDYKILSSAFPNGVYLNGGEMMTQNAVLGDWIDVAIVDKDSVTYPAGTILKTYIRKWYVDPVKSLSVKTPYAGLIPASMYIRIRYTSVGTVLDPQVAINYFLHRAI